MSPREVVVVVPFVGHLGGMERVARSQAARLAARGVPTTLLSCSHLREDGDAVELSSAPGLSLRRWPVLQRAPLLDATWVLPGALWLAARRSQVRAAVAHHLPTSGVLVGLASWLTGLPFVVVTHGSGVDGDAAALAALPWTGWRLRLVRRARFVVALNAEAEAELVAAGIEASRCRRIPNGCDTAAYRPPSTAERSAARARHQLAVSDIAVVYCGRLEGNKRLDVLFEAVATARSEVPGLRLLVAGDGPEEDALRSLARELGIDGRVSLLGRIDDIRGLLQAGDAFCLPSRSEGMSMALLEAMACGLPAVVSGAAGNREVVADGVDGWIVDDMSADSLRRCLLGLTDGDERARRGVAARATVAERFSLEVVDAAFASLLDEL